MSGLDFLKKQDGVEETTQDRVGGGSFVIDSGAHEAVIDKAYLVNSTSSKAVGVRVEATLSNGKKFRETIYVTNGEGKNTYLNKDNKPTYLPGFELVSNICAVTIGTELAELMPEDKVVEIYNAELKRNAPTSVKMLMELVGKSLILGIAKTKSFKQAKNAVSGKYEDTADIVEGNALINVFNTAGYTALEIKAKATEVSFINQFMEVYKADYVKDTTKKAGNAAAGGVSNTPPPTKSLFGNNAQA